MIPRFLIHIMLIGIPLVPTIYGQTSTAQKQSETRHIAWGPILETNYGITQPAFRAIGLDALSPEQAVSLLHGLTPESRKLEHPKPWSVVGLASRLRTRENLRPMTKCESM